MKHRFLVAALASVIYAVITDIRSVSKSRITKLSHYTISGNTKISDSALETIKTQLIRRIE